MSDPIGEFVKETGAKAISIQQLPEAGASATVKIELDGFEVLFTVRGFAWGEVLPSLRGLFAELKTQGATPVASYYKPQAPTRTKEVGDMTKKVGDRTKEAQADHLGDVIVGKPEALSFVCPQFALELRPDGKYKLSLFTVLGQTGTISKYPELSFVGSKERVWEELQPVAEGIDFSELPLQQACRWAVTYELGRPNSSGKPYKDLVSIEPLP